MTGCIADLDIRVEFRNVAQVGGDVHPVDTFRKEHSGLILGALEVVVVHGPRGVDARRTVEEKRASEPAPDLL